MTIDVSTITLSHGAHETRDDGTCLMEAVAWFAGERHSDVPQCASRVLGSFGMKLNDVLPGDKRQELRPLIPAIAGTAGDGLDERRGYLALDWLVRVYLPTWLDLAGLDEDSGSLRELTTIATMETAAAAGPVVRAARDHAGAARDAARDAAGAAARDAARAAARDVAEAAARDAAWAAAGDAAGDAAWDAAWDAARAKLAPTVEILQDSAIKLFRAMVTGEV